MNPVAPHPLVDRRPTRRRGVAVACRPGGRARGTPCRADRCRSSGCRRAVRRRCVRTPLRVSSVGVDQGSLERVGRDVRCGLAVDSVHHEERGAERVLRRARASGCAGTGTELCSATRPITRYWSSRSYVGNTGTSDMSGATRATSRSSRPSTVASKSNDSDDIPFDSGDVTSPTVASSSPVTDLSHAWSCLPETRRGHGSIGSGPRASRRSRSGNVAPMQHSRAQAAGVGETRWSRCATSPSSGPGALFDQRQLERKLPDVGRVLVEGCASLGLGDDQRRLVLDDDRRPRAAAGADGRARRAPGRASGGSTTAPRVRRAPHAATLSSAAPR